METRDHLDPEQLRAATAPRGPVAIIAGAGTGKTRTITHRIAHLVDGGFVNPDQVLAVTFTSRAASEMRERLAMMNVARVQARTFHASAMRQLGYFWPKYAGDLPWKLVDSKFPLMSRAARGAGLEPTTTLLKDLIGEVEWCKSSLIVAEDYPKVMVPERRDCPVSPEQFIKVFKNYEQLKATPEGMLLDFDDLLLNMAAAIESNVGIAEEFRSQYRTFVVDEYQDVTPLQQRLLDAWLGERDDLTVVGDANQTIYSFNGASPSYLLDFTTKFPEATTVRLHRDYRSTPQVVELANEVIGKAKGRAAGTRLKLEGQRPDGPEPEFVEYPDEAAEAKGVAEKIAQLIKEGVQPAEIAVLYRINAQAGALEYALEEAGIPYQVKGGEGFFSRAEIRQGLGALAKSARNFGGQPGGETGGGPGDAAGADSTGPETREEILNAAKAALAPVGLTATEPSGAQERQRWQSLNALVELIEEILTANPQISYLGVIGMLQERVRSKNPPKVQGVTLVSVHMAKGLEWDAVFLVGLYEGMFPIHHALKGAGAADAIEEERRLLYVGVTRAREHLHLSWALARQEGGKQSRVRTRFLDGLVPWEDEDDGELAIDLDQARRRRKTGAPKNACAVCGTALSTPEAKILGRCGQHSLETDQVVIGELREWRLETAKSMGVPAYVVFTDATLLAIAQRMPASPAELIQVPGVGPMKIEQFGEDVLAITANYASG